MILDGNEKETNPEHKHVVENIAEIIKYNSVKFEHSNSTTKTKHHADNEPPLLISNGLEVHSKTRKKELVNMLYNAGLSISYDRVITLRTQIASQVCNEYLQKGFVYPFNLHSGVFTTAAIDNIDHILTSTSALSSIHWTGISIFQHPDKELPEIEFRFVTEKKSDLKIQLPTSYTDIQPVLPKKPEPPKTTALLISDSFKIDTETKSWIEAIISDDQQISTSFSSFFSQQKTKKVYTSKGSLLPLIPESINSLAVIRHCMLQVQKIVKEANPDQRPVITGDHFM